MAFDSGEQHDHKYDTRIFDFHLRGGQDEEQSDIRERIAQDQQLHSQFSELSSAIAALSKCPTHSAPADLQQKVKARLAGAAPVRLHSSPPGSASAGETRPGVIRLHSWRELTAVAAMIVIAVGMGVPSLLQMRERGQRIACSNNLAQIGTALQAYVGGGGSLPYAGWSARDTWLASSDPGARLSPNRRHLYPLIAGRLLNANSLICPSGTDVPMTPTQVASSTDFVEARNVSYAYQNMSGVRPDPRGPGDMPIMGDNNPLFAAGAPILNRMGIGREAQANSPAHHGQGQNLLTLDGRVIWTRTPDSGLDGDNIWTLQGVDVYTGNEGPVAATDTQLIK